MITYNHNVIAHAKAVLLARGNGIPFSIIPTTRS